MFDSPKFGCMICGTLHVSLDCFRGHHLIEHETPVQHAVPIELDKLLVSELNIKDSRYTVIVRAYAFGQFRIQVCTGLPEYGGWGHGFIKHEM